MKFHHPTVAAGSVAEFVRQATDWVGLFRQPQVLLLLVVPVALLAWTWRRRSRRTVLPFDHGSPGRGLGWYLLIGAAESLAPLLLAVAIVILAGPRTYGEPKDKRKLTNIQLCVDISYSMTTEFGEGSRYDTAMKSVNDFVGYRKGDAVGLTFFGNSVMHWCPLTSDTNAITCSVPFMRPENVPPWFNGTEIARALRACKSVLVERQDGDRMIVLVTDGESYDLFNNAETLGRDLKAANITVFAIIIGMDRVQDEIATITGITGGEAFLAGDPDAMRAVFQRIDQMKQAPVEKSIADMLDDYRPFAAAGLALLACAALAAYGARYSPW